MTVRAKFRCTEIKRQTTKVPNGSGGWKDGEVQAITLMPVYGNGDPMEFERPRWHADQIVVLDGGRVVGVGTHEQLMDTCETYQEIVFSQLTAAEAS